MNLYVGERGIIVIERLYEPVVIRASEGGDFAIAERDGSIEVRHDGTIVYPVPVAEGVETEA